MIFRIKKTKGFTTLPNQMLRDTRITLKARGLLAQLLTHSVKYEISKKKVVNQNIEGKDAINSAFNELIRFGYIVPKKSRNKGRYQFEYDVYDTPIKGGLSKNSPERVIRSGLSASDNPHYQEISNKEKENHQKSVLQSIIINKAHELGLSDDDEVFLKIIEEKKKRAVEDKRIKNKMGWIITVIKNLVKEDLEIEDQKIKNDLNEQKIKNAEKKFRSLKKDERIKEIEIIFKNLNPYYRTYKEMCLVDGEIVGNPKMKDVFFSEYAKKAAEN